MSILSLNSGSSSVKYQLYDWDKQLVVASGVVDRVGLPGSNIVHKYNGQKIEHKDRCPDHKTAIHLILHFLLEEAKLIASVKDVEGVGHRVVHGGDRFSASVRIDEAVLEGIKSFYNIAPLHNPPNVVGIESAKEVLPDTPHVAIFDTAFHQTIPEYAYMYGIDYDLAKSNHIRRYGFHGSSHRFVSERAMIMLGNPQHSKIITVHIGNGSSLTAIQDGKSIDTSMGLTPLPGVIMGTRSGDIDPAVIQFMMQKLGENSEEVLNRLNKMSGMLGISGLSSDQRDIQVAAAKQDTRSMLALQMQAYSIRKYIGAYMAALGGLDALVFTAGIGENSSQFRHDVCAGLEGLGLELDQEKNKAQSSQERVISKDNAKMKILVIPTNEEYIIARDVIEIVRGVKNK
jgi:acetate kinase